MENLYPFYKNLFSNNVPVYKKSIFNYLKVINLPKYCIEERKLCELTKKGTKNLVNKIANNKIPGNDVLTKEFFETLLFEIKNLLLLSFKNGFLTEELGTSEKEIIKLLGKKKDIRLIKKRRPTSLLNSDVKLISKALAKRIKKLLFSLISPTQTVYLEEVYM